MNQRLVLLYRAIIPFTLFFYSFYSLSRPLIVASLTVLIAHLFLNSPFGEKWLREDLVALTDYLVVQTSSDEDELMAGLPTSSTRGQRLTKAQLDPVRAREAAITDERGQRPTKAKPDPVRAREAAITDERGQRPTKAKSDPVRAREAAITDERSQRLTKTQPDPVRAYQAVTTDELSIRGQRPTRAQPNPVRAQGQ